MLGYLETVIVIVTEPGAALGETLTGSSALRTPGTKPMPPGFEAGGIVPGPKGVTVTSLEFEVAPMFTEMLTLAKFPTFRLMTPDSPAYALPVQVATVPLDPTEHVRVLVPKTPAAASIPRGSLTVRVVVVVSATNAKTVVVPASRIAIESNSQF